LFTSVIYKPKIISKSEDSNFKGVCVHLRGYYWTQG